MSTPHDKATVPFNDLSRNAAKVWARAALRWNDTLSSGRVILGSAVEDFEAQFAAYLGGGTVVGVANGTDALELAMRAVGVSRGSSVVLAANAGFYASTAICAIGASPRFVDVDPAHVTPGVAEVERAMSSGHVHAVVITHLYGRLAFDIERIAASCRAAGVPLIEDCAQSHGSRSTVTVSGAFGDVSAFSFYPTKNLGALGDGGAVFTRSSDIAERVRALRQYGWSNKYVVEHAGGRNSRLDEIQAIVLLDALTELDARNEVRRSIVNRYRQDSPWLSFVCASQGREEWVGHLCVVSVDNRDLYRKQLAEAGVMTDIHFPVPDHRQPVLAHLQLPALPVTEALAQRVLSLPCFPDMTDAEISTVAEALAKVRP
jgi:dTDP-3-amino-2,3,6-trideoxy-4-keto-D-glucose/dTDP-3-amino-3,4,6-trideoxy-alpha-D-glucose/dTDP-2,6-dideoxy-D-kanosamine transaminase